MIDTVKKAYDFIKKLPKGVLAILITAMPVMCYLAITFYLSEHAKNEKTSKILEQSRIHTENQKLMMKEIDDIKLSVKQLYEYIDQTSIDNNNYVISQVGKKMQMVLSYQNPKQDFLIKLMQDWIDTEAQRAQLEKQKIKQDSITLSIGVRKK